jgi:hypothetical protein
MNKYTETQPTIPTFAQEVRRILEGDYRVQHVEDDGHEKWTLHLGRCNRDDAETARLKIVDDLMETLGEEASEGLASRADVLYRAANSYIELEIIDEDGIE